MYARRPCSSTSSSVSRSVFNRLLVDYRSVVAWDLSLVLSVHLLAIYVPLLLTIGLYRAQVAVVVHFTSWCVCFPFCLSICVADGLFLSSIVSALLLSSLTRSSSLVSHVLFLYTHTLSVSRTYLSVVARVTTIRVLSSLSLRQHMYFAAVKRD